MLKAARDLTLAEANTVMGYLIQGGKLTLKANSTPYAGDWQTGITSPRPATRVVVEPTRWAGSPTSTTLCTRRSSTTSTSECWWRSTGFLAG